MKEEAWKELDGLRARLLTEAELLASMLAAQGEGEGECEGAGDSDGVDAEEGGGAPARQSRGIVEKNLSTGSTLSGEMSPLPPTRSAESLTSAVTGFYLSPSDRVVEPDEGQTLPPEPHLLHQQTEEPEQTTQVQFRMPLGPGLEPSPGPQQQRLSPTSSPRQLSPSAFKSASSAPSSSSGARYQYQLARPPAISVGSRGSGNSAGRGGGGGGGSFEATSPSIAVVGTGSEIIIANEGSLPAKAGSVPIFQSSSSYQASADASLSWRVQDSSPVVLGSRLRAQTKEYPSSSATSGLESVDIAEMEDRLALDAATRTSHAEAARKASFKRMQTQHYTGIRAFVAGNKFEIIVAAAVFFNAVLIGVEVEVNAGRPGEGSPMYLFMPQHIFTLFFTAELVLRVKAFGFYHNFVRNGLSWEWFDAFIVLSSLVELTFDVLFLAGQRSGAPTIAGVSQLRIGRIVKVTKLIRTLRVQRLIRIVAPLRTLVFSIIVTLKSLLWAMCLLFLMIYVVAVVIVQTVTSHRASLPPEEQAPFSTTRENFGVGEETLSNVVEDYFWNLERAMWTLLQSISGGLSWREAAVPLTLVSPWSGAVFTAFICFVYFAVLNVVTGVFCSSAIETTQHTPEVIASAMITSKNSYEKNLRQLFSKVDIDKSGMLTLAEMQHFLSDELLHAQLSALEINVSDAWTLFRLLDTDRNGAICLEEFVEGCMTMKGVAKGIDLASLRSEIRSLSRRVDRMTLNFEDLSKIEERLRSRSERQGSVSSSPSPKRNRSRSLFVTN